MSIRQNTLYNLIGAIIPLAVSLITIPVYIGLIGEERFGVLAIVWLLVGYFGLFDLGLGRATAQRIAALRDATAQERAEVFWTALAMNTGLAIVGGLLIWPVAVYFFENIFTVEEALRAEILRAIPWLVLAVPIAIVSGVFSGALQGRDRFLELNVISVLGTVLIQVMPLIVAQFMSTDLTFLLATVLFSRLLTIFALFERCKRHVICSYKPSYKSALAKKLLHFGGWVTVSSFVGPLMVILDRLIIGSVLGAKAVAYYTVPFTLAERTTIIPVALTTALFPRFSAASSREEKLLASNALEVLAVIMTPIVVTIIIFLGPFLAWWVGVDFAEQSTLVGQVLLLGFWVNGFARVALAQLYARGKPDLVAKCHLLEVLPYFVLLYLGMHYLGLVGAAIAFSSRVFFDFVLLSALAGGLWQALRLFFVPLMLLIFSLLIPFMSSPDDMSWLSYAIVNILVTMSWAWWKAPEFFRMSVLDKLKSISANKEHSKE